MLAVDYQNVQAPQQQNCISLLNQLCHLSEALREVREQRCLLFQQQQALYQQEHILDPNLYKQEQAVYQQLSTLLKEYSTILGQLASIRVQRFSPNF
jgi:ethanolamine utilization protein EutP (predicted NTPase)